MPIITGAGGLAFLSATAPAALTGPVHLGDTVNLSDASGEAPIIVTRHQTARALLRDQRWSRRPPAARGPVGPASVMSVTSMDGRRHAAVRGLIAPLFSRRAVSGLHEQARRRAHQLCDQLLGAGPPADLAARFCGPFTFSVQCDLLGVPEHARGSLREASLRRSGLPDASAQEIYDAETALHGEVSAVLRHLSGRAGRGGFSQLIALHQAGILDDRELRGLASSLLFDGHLLTSSQIASTVAALLCCPAARSGAVGPHGLAPAAREEILRWSPAITLGMPRWASAAVRLGDIAVREGQAAVVAFGVVNRDPAIFGHPEILDVRREARRHLAFGYGVHYCLGAQLARLQLDVAVSVLLARLPGLRLAVDQRDLTWSASQTIRGLRALPVTWARGPAAGPGSTGLSRGTRTRTRQTEPSHAGRAR